MVSFEDFTRNTRELEQRYPELIQLIKEQADTPEKIKRAIDRIYEEYDGIFTIKRKLNARKDDYIYQAIVEAFIKTQYFTHVLSDEEYTSFLEQIETCARIVDEVTGAVVENDDYD